MERNKKDAAQDVLNLYNQMQEDETDHSAQTVPLVSLK